MPTTSTLEIKIDRMAEAYVVRIIGDANVRDVDGMERQLLPIVALSSARVVLDLSEMTFISSLGISVLLNLQRGVRGKGGTVRFAAPQPLIRDLFTKCRLDAAMKLYPGVKEAIAGP